MTNLNISSIAALTPAAAPSGSSGSAPSPKSLGDQNVFLQLLITQLKNQDPTQPTDGTAFVTQLAQFTTLQQQTQGTSDLDKIVAILSSAGTTGTTNTNNQ